MSTKNIFSGFPAKIHTEEDGTYWAEFLTVPVFSQGETLSELDNNMQEALLCYLDAILKENKRLPIKVVNKTPSYA